MTACPLCPLNVHGGVSCRTGVPHVCLYTFDQLRLPSWPAPVENRDQYGKSWVPLLFFAIWMTDDRSVDPWPARARDTTARGANIAETGNVTVVEQIEAEKALRELNETLEQRVQAETRERVQIWNVSQDLLVVADLNGIYLSVNPAWSTTLGWSASELVGPRGLRPDSGSQVDIRPFARSTPRSAKPRSRASSPDPM